jgi:hypothetical protein
VAALGGLSEGWLLAEVGQRRTLSEGLAVEGAPSAVAIEGTLVVGAKVEDMSLVVGQRAIAEVVASIGTLAAVANQMEE